LIAACAVSAIAVSSASAALPELGRCLPVEKVQEGKKARYHGAYKNATCTKASPADKGKYEWSEGPGADNTFTATVNEGWTLETVGGERVECELGHFDGGEYTGAKTEKFSGISLYACETGTGTLCMSAQKEAEHEPGRIEDLGTVEGELGTISSGAKPAVGWDLKSVPFEFVCGELPEVESVQTVEGSVIGTVMKGADGNLNRMGEETQVNFKEAAGVQLPEAFEGGAADTLKTLRVVGASKAEEQTGLSSVETDKGAEPLEIRDKG
jgi:hypothetical protein